MIYHMYTRGSGESSVFTVPQGHRLIHKSVVTPKSFKRKAYTLLEEQRYVLVHYFDESKLLD